MARGSEGNAQILRQPRYAKCEVLMRSPPATYPAIHGTQRFKRQPKKPRRFSPDTPVFKPRIHRKIGDVCATPILSTLLIRTT
jgi:hypothetical protein